MRTDFFDFCIILRKNICLPSWLDRDQRMKFGKIKTWLVISKLLENPLEGKRRGKPEQPRHLPWPDPCPQVCFYEILSKNQEKKVRHKENKAILSLKIILLSILMAALTILWIDFFFSKINSSYFSYTIF